MPRENSCRRLHLSLPIYILALSLSLICPRAFHFEVLPPSGSFITIPTGKRSATVYVKVAIESEDFARNKCQPTKDIQRCHRILTGEEQLKLSVTNIVTGASSAFLFEHIGGKAYASAFNIHELKYGTQTIHLAVSSASSELLAETYHHFEVVPASLAAAQYIPQKFSKISFNQHFAFQTSDLTISSELFPVVKPIRIVLVGALNLDGQKTIWLEQMARLPKSRFRFNFACFSCPEEIAQQQIQRKSGMAYLLQQLGIPLVTRGGLHVHFEVTNMSNFVENAVMTLRRWNSYHQYGLLSMSQTEIEFIQNFHNCFIDTLRGYDIMVFGNSGMAELNDHLLVEGARMAGVKRIIMELTTANSGMLENDHIDALVSPSEFALSKLWYEPFLTKSSKEAFHGNLKYELHSRKWRKVVAVISPGVDVTKHTKVQVGNHAQGTKIHNYTCRYSVGYVARIMPEKSPGIFLKTAKKIVERLGRRLSSTRGELPPNCRHIEFLVVGDGKLRTYMMKLGNDLLLSKPNSHDINVSLRFLGWVSREVLVTDILPSLDLLLNPSLTPETFGISNIESMVAGTPVVSFGVGGQGEYLNKFTNGSAGLVVGTKGSAYDNDVSAWSGLMADLAISVLTMDDQEKLALTRSTRSHGQQYDISHIMNRSADMYTKVILSDEGNSWRRRAERVSNHRNHISLIAAWTSNNEFSSESFKWYRIEVVASELVHFPVMNQSHWWKEFGKCAKIGSIVSQVMNARSSVSKMKSTCGAHCQQILQLQESRNRVSGLDLSIIGLASSWSGVSDYGGITLVSGSHLAASLVIDEGTRNEAQQINFILGVGKVSSHRRVKYNSQLLCN